jgi:hypothetical protein
MAWATVCPGGSHAAAEGASGSWKFSTDNQDQPELSYSENDKIIFFVGCGHAFAIWAIYPGARKKADAKAGITIENGKSQRNFAGEAQDGSAERGQRNTTYFYQFDLGYDHSAPDTYGKKWKAREQQLLDFFDSGQPLTISAEGKSYMLPPIKIGDWKSRFRKIC